MDAENCCAVLGTLSLMESTAPTLNTTRLRSRVSKNPSIHHYMLHQTPNRFQGDHTSFMRSLCLRSMGSSKVFLIVAASAMLTVEYECQASMMFRVTRHSRWGPAVEPLLVKSPICSFAAALRCPSRVLSPFSAHKEFFGARCVWVYGSTGLWETSTFLMYDVLAFS